MKSARLLIGLPSFDNKAEARQCSNVGEDRRVSAHSLHFDVAIFRKYLTPFELF